MDESHPTPERTAAALEAAGLNPYLLLERGAVARTGYAEVGLSVARERFVLLSSEDIPVPPLVPEQRARLYEVAVDLASRWGLVWRGSIEGGRVRVSFGAEVSHRLGDEPDETGLRLHDAILAAHYAHQSLRHRALTTAWRGGFQVQLPTLVS